MPNWVRLKQLDQTAEHTWGRSDNGILYTIRNDATASLCTGNPGQQLEIALASKIKTAKPIAKTTGEISKQTERAEVRCIEQPTTVQDTGGEK